jgi:Regulator of chromosome condensation (RCC1) repeat
VTVFRTSRFYIALMSFVGLLAFQGTGAGLASQVAQARVTPTPAPGAAVAQPPKTARFIQISAGAFFGCGVRTNHTLLCWGSKSHGETLAPSGTFTQVSVASTNGSGDAAGDFACALSTAQGGKVAVVCWGNKKHYGKVPAGTFSQVTAGGQSTCALQGAPGETGKIVCWGSHLNVPSGKFSSLSSGEPWCALRPNGAPVCWSGYVGTTGQKGPFTQITVSGGDVQFTCGLQANGKFTCWGGNNKLYNKGLNRQTSTYSQISAGLYALCGVRTSDAGVSCAYLQSGSKPASGRFTQVSTGWRSYVCALKIGGQAVCW